MKKYEIVILKKAAIELRDQEDYIRFEQDDPESADIFIQRFLSALERLEYLPYSCPAMILGKRQRRKLVVGNHIAVFSDSFSSLYYTREIARTMSSFHVLSSGEVIAEKPR